MVLDADPQHVATGEGPVPGRARMGIALLALSGLFISIYLLLHRVGMIGSLACGVDGGCSTVQSSPYATFAGLPVPLLGVVGYAVLFALAMIGLTLRGSGSRMVAGALVVLSGLAFAFSAYLTALEAFVIHAWCRWCVVSALIATAIFILALTEIPQLRSAAPREES